MKQEIKIKRAKEKVEAFKIKKIKCPICRKGFQKNGCSHTIEQAEEFLFNKYIDSVLGSE